MDRFEIGTNLRENMHISKYVEVFYLLSFFSLADSDTFKSLITLSKQYKNTVLVARYYTVHSLLCPPMWQA